MFKLLIIVAFSFLLYAQDDAIKEYNLGIKYLSKQNMSEAFKHLSKSADLNNSDAQYNLALMYYRGDGTKQNLSKSLELLEVAAKAEHKKALENIGRVYMQNIKFDKAAYWLEKNAVEGDENAYYLLAQIYCAQEKFVLAEKWANKSIKSGNKEAKILWKECQLDKY